MTLLVSLVTMKSFIFRLGSLPKVSGTLVLGLVLVLGVGVGVEHAWPMD